VPQEETGKSWAELRQDRARRAESAVVDLLVRAGFHIVARNLHLGHLELDVVARCRELVVVVEVRARSRGGWVTGFGSIDAHKRRRVRQAAERLWRKRYRRDPSVTRLRIDAAAVLFDESGMTITYCKGAF
jgi:putative endonuclease